jgi:peptidoglycan/LPS O-acetylase OafA/YrhL
MNNDRRRTMTTNEPPAAHDRLARWLVERGMWQIAEGMAGLVHYRYRRAKLRQCAATACFTAALVVKAIGDAVIGGGR